MKYNNNQQAFFALLQAGLWEKDVQLSTFEKIDLSIIEQLAEEQAVVGLVAAGLEHVVDTKLPKEDVLQIVGQTLQLEQQNIAMNHFISVIVDKMRKAGIYTLLVKGQGIAQCYERPMWRACGDVDLFLSEDNYNKAVTFLAPLASKVNEENPYNRHLAMTIDPWAVELHGTLRSSLWNKLDREIDKVQDDVFFGGRVRSWMNESTQVFMPGADEDVVFVFAHILQHYYKEGIGLRQICDWCRLVWTFRDKLNLTLLKQRIYAMGVMSEWKAFASLAVNRLGMPAEAMPFYSDSKCWKRKDDKILSFILETGTFGHNRDYSYYDKYPYVVFKMISFWRHIKDLFRYFLVFPLDSMKFGWQMMVTGVSMTVKGK